MACLESSGPIFFMFEGHSSSFYLWFNIYLLHQELQHCKMSKFRCPPPPFLCNKQETVDSVLYCSRFCSVGNSGVWREPTLCFRFSVHEPVKSRQKLLTSQEM